MGQRQLDSTAAASTATAEPAAAEAAAAAAGTFTAWTRTLACLRIAGGSLSALRPLGKLNALCKCTSTDLLDLRLGRAGRA